MAHAVDFVVDGGILFDESVRGGDVGLGLIVVVIGHKIAHGVVWKKFPKFRRKLRRKSFIVGNDQSRSVEFLDDVGHGEGFAGAGYAQQHLIVHPLPDAFGEPFDGLGLISRGLVFGMQFEQARPSSKGISFIITLCILIVYNMGDI